MQVFPYVDQLDILSKADVFITHCGMNSVSESLYMATPMVLYPQTGERQAVARRASELGAGVVLKDDSVSGIQKAVQKILNDTAFAAAAKKCCDDFRSSPGTTAAADFIESAPHQAEGPDPLCILDKESGKYRLIYWLTAVVIAICVGVFIGGSYIWLVGLIAGIMNGALNPVFEKRAYEKLIKEKDKKNRE